MAFGAVVEPVGRDTQYEPEVYQPNGQGPVLMTGVVRNSARASMGNYEWPSTLLHNKLPFKPYNLLLPVSLRKNSLKLTLGDYKTPTVCTP